VSIIPNRRVVGVLAALACGLAACGSGGGSSVSTKPLAGTINGHPWMFVDGETDFFLSSNPGDHFFAILYDTPVVASCTVGDPPLSKGHIILEIPKMPGVYTRGGTFEFPDPTTGRDTDAIATTGTLEVTAISSTEITGGVKMALDAQNSVDGQFTISVCQQ
jgi:hypothetical protein